MNFGILERSPDLASLARPPHPRCPLAKPPRSPPTASATGSSTTTPWSAGARSPSGSIRRRSRRGDTRGRAQRGAQFEYSDLAIECLLTLRAVYHLTLRATEGFARSLFELMSLDLPVPDYTTLCRRAATVRITLPKRAEGPLHLVLDSTGLKVYGEGEWKVRQHGYSKRRTWLKLHLAVDPQTHEIQAAMVTDPGVTDAETVPALLEQVENPIESAAADGAYDRQEVYDALEQPVGPGGGPAPAGCEDQAAWQHLRPPAGPG